MAEQIVIKWGGTDVLAEAKGSIFVRNLGKELAFGTMPWPVPIVENNFGGFVAGDGVPEARQVGFMLYVDLIPGSSVTNLLYETQKKWDALCKQFRPTRQPVVMEVTRTDGDEQTTTRNLLVRAEEMFSWAWNFQGDGSAGARLTGSLRFPVTATAHYPWWIQEQDQETGSNTSLDATLEGMGDRSGGWRATFTCPSGQTAGITPTIIVDGQTVPFVWQTGVTWAVGDVAVIECYYPMSPIWAGGIVSYIIKASGVIQNYGVLSPTLTGVTDLPLPPTEDEFDVAIDITGLNATGTCAFDWATLHGSF